MKALLAILLATAVFATEPDKLGDGPAIAFYLKGFITGLGDSGSHIPLIACITTSWRDELVGLSHGMSNIKNNYMTDPRNGLTTLLLTYNSFKSKYSRCTVGLNTVQQFYDMLEHASLNTFLIAFNANRDIILNYITTGLPFYTNLQYQSFGLYAGMIARILVITG